MKNIFGQEIIEEPVVMNIYCDEIQSKKCPYTGEEWFYIGMIVEKVFDPLLKDIRVERFCNNFDEESPYYEKNNRIIHWCEINDIDTKNICKRWFEYIINPGKSEGKFYAYILGVNESKLNRGEFDPQNKFNSEYNRFFRSALLYALKVFFPGKKIIVENIFHEKGQQEYHEYFPWHCIYKIKNTEDSFQFKCPEITFIPKDHKIDRRSNLIQLCDAFMGACTSIIHGINKSNTSKYREELMDFILPLLNSMMNWTNNVKYKHAKRIMIRFFPKENTAPGNIRRMLNQFYKKRTLCYGEIKSGQMSLF
jgi:hypothetical protein